MGLVMGAAAVIVGGIIVAMVASGNKKAPPKEAPKPLAPVVVAPPVETPKAPVKVPPPPLTDKERAFIEGLFKQAEPHMKKFYELADQGWKNEDEAERNIAWLSAKKEAHKAISIVNEAMEDYDQFPTERQDAYMGSWNARLTQWQKDLMGKIGKTHD